MTLEKTFGRLINEGRISRDRVISLEAEIGDLRQRADEEFRDLSPELRSGLGDILEKGIIGYAQELIYFGHEHGRILGSTIPHINSNLFDLAKRYIERNGQQTMFSAKLVFGDVCEFYENYANGEGDLRETAFEEHEETYRDEFPHLPFPSLYAKCMSEGAPEVVEVDGRSMLKIYRGLGVPAKDTYSEVDEAEIDAGTINLTNPGVDWTPIRTFAEGYQGTKGNRVLLSALVPLDDEEIVRQSIDNSTLDDHWRGEYDTPLETLTDCLIVVVPVSHYHLMKDLKVEYTDASFERR
jgi:hypothetical protein